MYQQQLRATLSLGTIAGSRRGVRRVSSSARAALGLPDIPGVEPIEVKLPGLALRGWTVGNPSSSRKVIGLHGWIDNSATHSFTYKPYVDAGFQFVSLDLPGHGRSDWRSLQDQYSAGGYALAVMEAAKFLGWAESTAFSLCSHSMSAGISSLVAGAMGSKVASLVLLEGIGMNTKAESQSAAGLNQAYEARGTLLKRLNKGSGGKKVYPSLDTAAQARVATVARYPGNQSIELEAARLLVARGSKQQEREQEQDGSGSGRGSGGYSFCHDPRLMEPSAGYISEAQMLDYLKRITAPTLCVTGTTGWPWPSGLMLGRITSVPSMEHHHIIGGHHCHLDPSTAPVVCAIVGDFLRRNGDAIDARIEEAQAKAKAKAAAAAAAEAAAASKASRHPVLVAGGRVSLNPTAPHPGTERGERGDDDAVRAAREIASSASASGAEKAIADDHESSSSSSQDRQGSSTAAGHKQQVSSSSSAAQAIWTPLHVSVMHSEPYAAATVAPLAAQASYPRLAASVGGYSHVHMLERVLVADRVRARTKTAASASSNYPRYGWATGEHEEVVAPAAGGSKGAAAAVVKHHRQHVQEASEAEVEEDEQRLSQLTWCELPDHVAGLPFLAQAKRNSHSHGHGSGSGYSALKAIKFGALAPRVFLQTMPTLEAVTGVYGSSKGDDDAAAKGLQAMEAKGSAY